MLTRIIFLKKWMLQISCEVNIIEGGQKEDLVAFIIFFGEVNKMENADLTTIKSQLVERRQRLQQSVNQVSDSESLYGLLREVDAALKRLWPPASSRDR